MAVFDKVALMGHDIQPLFRAFLRFHRSICIHLRKVFCQLCLRILAFRMKEDTLNLHMVFLTMVKAGQTHDTALVDTGRVTTEVLDQPLLDRTEPQHLTAGDEPIGVQ